MTSREVAGSANAVIADAYGRGGRKQRTALAALSLLSFRPEHRTMK